MKFQKKKKFLYLISKTGSSRGSLFCKNFKHILNRKIENGIIIFVYRGVSEIKPKVYAVYYLILSTKKKK